jgi:hypothetical protein
MSSDVCPCGNRSSAEAVRDKKQKTYQEGRKERRGESTSLDQKPAEILLLARYGHLKEERKTSKIACKRRGKRDGGQGKGGGRDGTPLSNV